jgi:hypothetical protein
MSPGFGRRARTFRIRTGFPVTMERASEERRIWPPPSPSEPSRSSMEGSLYCCRWAADTSSSGKASIFHEVNYHCEPLLDITRPAPHWLGVNDLVITSDVFEHVPPPIQTAFDNLYALLKPGGVVVFSVPFSLESETREHYPDLHQYSLRQEGNAGWVLENVTRDGRREQFRVLFFMAVRARRSKCACFQLQPCNGILPQQALWICACMTSRISSTAFSGGTPGAWCFRQ